MFKFVTGSKWLLIRVVQVPLVKRCFVYDFSKLNTIEDDDLYNLVFSHITVSNGLTKTTRSKRFEDLDNITISLIGPVKETYLHDIGVSNGITSLDLYNKIDGNAPTFEFCISDKYARIYYRGNKIKKFYDADGNLICVNFLFIHLSPYIGKIFFLSRWFFKLFSRKTVLNKHNYKEILLLAPEVYRKILNGNIKMLEFDVFETLSTRPFTFLRCLNVLMTGYFSKERIHEGVTNLQKNLAEGGYLLLGRTDAANTNHATFYTKQDNRLQVVEVVNNGFDYNNPI